MRAQSSRNYSRPTESGQKSFRTKITRKQHKYRNKGLGNSVATIIVDPAIVLAVFLQRSRDTDTISKEIEVQPVQYVERIATQKDKFLKLTAIGFSISGIYVRIIRDILKTQLELISFSV